MPDRVLTQAAYVGPEGLGQGQNFPIDTQKPYSAFQLTQRKK
jgi:hypothetical protein